MRYYTTDDNSVLAYDSTDGWADTSYQTVDFGSTEQEVSDEFATYLAENAEETALSISIASPEGETLATAGTYCDKNIKVTPILENITVAPSAEDQIKTPSDGYAGIGSVTVEAISTDYIVPSGTLNVSENGTHDVTNYASVDVNVPIPEGYVKPSGTLTITENSTVDVTQYTEVTVNVDISKPQLLAPTIGLSESTLIVTDNANNGAFVAGYDLYIGGTYKTAVTNKTIDLATLSLEAGTYSLTVKANGVNFIDSVDSNVVEYVVIDTVPTPTIEIVDGVVNFYDDSGVATEFDLLVNDEVKTSVSTTKLINFTIAGTSYQAEEDMTWYEWCESSYNTDEYITTNSSTNSVGNSSGSIIGVYGADIIVANTNYTLSSSPGGGGAD